MATQRIEELLKKIIGLDSASIGSATIDRSVRRRMLACKLSDEQAYLELLTTSPPELQSLIDEVTVPETWFFRGVEPFRLLAEYVAMEWMKSHPGKIFRVLSIPCSSGEEPYSIAMVLMDIGMQKNQFNIDAVDINTRIIARAKLGVYGRNSFRGDEGDAVHRYFHPVANGYAINDAVRESVNFRHENLLDKDFLVGVSGYNAIFCRNLLIYFDRATQASVLIKLHNLLAMQGILFVGHAESGCVDSALFSLIRREGAFAYRKGVPNKEETHTGYVSAIAAGNSNYKYKGKLPAHQKTIPAISTNKITKNTFAEASPGKIDENYLIKAIQAADRGELEPAARFCENHLEVDVHSVAAYYLLAVVREAQGNIVLAEELFHKTLYLDPQHYQALVHLAGHAERQGDSAAAATYRARAKRLAEAGMS